MNPFIFQAQFTRVYRQSLNTIAILLFFTALFKSLTLIRNVQLVEAKAKNIKAKKKYSKNTRIIETNTLIKISLLLGSTFAVLHSLEDDSYWLLPFTILIIVFQITRVNKAWTIHIKTIGLMSVLSLFVYIIPIGFIQIENDHIYGAAKIEDFYTGSFADAMKVWESVKNGADLRAYVPISKGQREAVYKVSPLAKTLEPYLELPPNTGWLHQSCNSPTHMCDEAGAWTPWQLRDAAVAAANIQNEKEFQNFSVISIFVFFQLILFGLLLLPQCELEYRFFLCLTRANH
jgi:hypothetical protein